MGCQRKIVEKIIDECKADYVLNVKANQEGLLSDIVEHFQNQEMVEKRENLNIAHHLTKTKGNPIGDSSLSMLRTIEKGHGRIESRTYYYSQDIQWMIDARKVWRGLKGVGLVYREVETNGNKSSEYAYFIGRGYNFLKEEMLLYAKENLSKDGVLKALISDNDREFQRIALSRGFKPTQSKEDNAVFDINADAIKYVLPQGYRISSLDDNCDLYKFNRVLWRGFNHEGEPPTTAEQIEDRRISLSGPHLDLNLCVVVVSPDDEYVSYCGMWYDKKTNNALVEPVATDPLHRRKGLGKAAVLEAIKRCGMEGAKQAYVGSSQQFYYQIGFSPIPSDTFWEC